MSPSETVDVAILGAGPAGCCAALRLLSLGYRVALIERSPFPRSQIGESLSPGVWGILEYIGAADTIKKSRFLQNLPARIIWERREPDVIPAGQRGPGLMVNRADFDGRLLALAKERGALLLQPAEVRTIEGTKEARQLQVHGPERRVLLQARLILDATGRAGRNAAHRVPIAPPTLALWADVDGHNMPRETRVEAHEEGWFWGAQLVNGQYRIMAFIDRDTVRQANSPDATFHSLMRSSRLFAEAVSNVQAVPIHTCSATPYLDNEPWMQGCIKVGECAFALDPLSSSGVEKAMRLTLQAVIAANTLLKNPDSVGLARKFYESRLLESVATHAVWTQNYYAQAWPGTDQRFWRDRSMTLETADLNHFSKMIGKLQVEILHRRQFEARQRGYTGANHSSDLSIGMAESEWLEAPIALSSELRIRDTACVIDDQVQLRPAVTHPALERPVAFLAGCDLVPLLAMVPLAQNQRQLVALWSTRIPSQAAMRIAGWLREKGLLICGMATESR